ncbi:hypothetical protein C0431_12465 [bacterium]|nr:hypothetical protein [bacterium]
MGKLKIEYAGVIFESVEDFAETLEIKERFVTKRLEEGLTGSEIVERWAERQRKLEACKYIGM